MSNYTFPLETLPLEVILETLHTLKSFSDLYTFLASSPICLRLFNRYTASILTPIAINIVGGSAWKEAAEILIYQRHMHEATLDYVALNKDIEAGFTLQKSDIPQLVANQRFFESCSFRLHTVLSFCSRWSISDPYQLKSSNPSAMSLCLPGKPSFTVKNALSAKLFYQTWLCGLHFQHDTVKAFALRPPISEQQGIDYNLISRLMYNNQSFRKFLCSERPSSGGVAEYYVTSKFFTSRWQTCSAVKIHKSNHLLFTKMIFHLKRFKRSKKSKILRQKFLYAYPSRSVECLVEEFRLDDRKGGEEKNSNT